MEARSMGVSRWHYWASVVWRRVYDVRSSSFDSLLIIDSGIGSFPEHAWRYLLPLVREEGCLDAIDSGIGQQLELSVFRSHFSHAHASGGQAEHSWLGKSIAQVSLNAWVLIITIYCFIVGAIQDLDGFTDFATIFIDALAKTVAESLRTVEFILQLHLKLPVVPALSGGSQHVFNLRKFVRSIIRIGLILGLIIATWSQPFPGMVEFVNLPVSFFLFLRQTLAIILFRLLFSWNRRGELETF